MENIVKILFGEYSAKINITRGANCISLKNSKYNASVLREPDYSKPLDNPYLYGMPILFPVNRIEGGEFVFENRKYRFPINEAKIGCHLHGELHALPFIIKEQNENSVRCVYTSNGDYMGFPHAFKVDICYTLDNRGFVQETEIFNLSDENMPLFLRFHTTFNIPFVKDSVSENVCVFAEVGDEIERNMSLYLPTGKILPSDTISKQFNSGEFAPLEKSISRHYRAQKSGAIELYDKVKKLRVIYENDEKFKWRLFYNGNADEFICLEPQTCMANCQNSPFDRDYAGFDYIKPYSSKKYTSRIYIT
ncbi:MAG: aldose 1-epimerase, partial [Clostridia bacterium]|nr:aldose 1-epimerase [Clostridia bacterium]